VYPYRVAPRPSDVEDGRCSGLEGVPRAARLKVSVELVGVAYQDEQNRFADFHALRYNFVTCMRRHGVADNFARKQTRHQTIRQMDGYTVETQLPIFGLEGESGAGAAGPHR